MEAVGGHLGDIQPLLRELRERYLLDVTPNNNRLDHYRLHPLVREVEGPRLRRDREVWQAAHRSAGTWYAGQLSEANGSKIRNARLALHLARARHHLLEAQEPQELQKAMRRVHSYIEGNYGFSAGEPKNDVDRDAEISLLRVYLADRGAPGVEYHFASLLSKRAGPGDLTKALPHAQWATVQAG